MPIDLYGLQIPDDRAQYVRWAREAARLHKIPESIFVRQLWQENRFRPFGTSKAGARGIAQFMPDTAKDMGVDLDDNTPRGIQKQIFGAAKYLRWTLDQFGGDPRDYHQMASALAAYNQGIGNVKKRGLNGAIGHSLETAQYLDFVMGEDRVNAALEREGAMRGTFAGASRGFAEIDSAYDSEGREINPHAPPGSGARFTGQDAFASVPADAAPTGAITPGSLPSRGAGAGASPSLPIQPVPQFPGLPVGGGIDTSPILAKAAALLEKALGSEPPQPRAVPLPMALAAGLNAGVDPSFPQVVGPQLQRMQNAPLEQHAAEQAHALSGLQAVGAFANTVESLQAAEMERANVAAGVQFALDSAASMSGGAVELAEELMASDSHQAQLLGKSILDDAERVDAYTASLRQLDPSRIGVPLAKEYTTIIDDLRKKIETAQLEYGKWERQIVSDEASIALKMMDSSSDLDISSDRAQFFSELPSVYRTADDVIEILNSAGFFTPGGPIAGRVPFLRFIPGTEARITLENKLSNMRQIFINMRAGKQITEGELRFLQGSIPQLKDLPQKVLENTLEIVEFFKRKGRVYKMISFMPDQMYGDIMALAGPLKHIDLSIGMGGSGSGVGTARSTEDLSEDIQAGLPQGSTVLPLE